jgi:hypothetical protein
MRYLLHMVYARVKSFSHYEMTERLFNDETSRSDFNAHLQHTFDNDGVLKQMNINVKNVRPVQVDTIVVDLDIEANIWEFLAHFKHVPVSFRVFNTWMGFLSTTDAAVDAQCRTFMNISLKNLELKADWAKLDSHDRVAYFKNQMDNVRLDLTNVQMTKAFSKSIKNQTPVRPTWMDDDDDALLSRRNSPQVT